MRTRFVARQLAYDLRESLLFRPAAMVVACGALGLLLPWFEGGAGASLVAALPPMEPGAAQVVLGTLAGATMTVVSVVYSILLVALSLASVQFSTRILASFVRDVRSQLVLGLLVGTFVYTLFVLRTVRTDPAWVPVGSLYVGIGLALGSLAALVWFIHHIVMGIQANNLVAHLADEAAPVLASVFGDALAPGEEPEAGAVPPPPRGIGVRAHASGYIQLVSVEALLEAARGGRLVGARGMGQFVTGGAVLAWWEPPAGAATTEHPDPAAVTAAFDLGPTRTLQDDAEWGPRQIVDIALKALSPAVNDPSTAATCLDQLGRLLAGVGSRRTPQRRWERDGSVVELPVTDFVRMTRLSFDQIRQYGRADLSTALRILRVLADVADATPHARGRAELLRQGRLTLEAARAAFPAEALDELDQRWETLRARCAA